VSLRPASAVGLALVLTVATGARAASPTPGAPVAPAASATAGPSVRHERALFALIIGVNESLDPEVPALRYADDDAARYLDLFRALGARAYLLAHLDANTRRLHPQAAAEALPARRPELARAVAGLARDVAQARERGIESVLYVIYAGHGDARSGTEYLTLEDGRIDGATLLAEVVRPPGADQNHVIIDACQAYLLAFERGAGGARRPVHGFVELEAASRQGRIGYLLSTSTTGETHEWAGFEAGVFSHEVRSGLYGAADADGDGVVSYAEIAAFVTRANAAIVNDRFRPRVVAQAPPGDGTLLDLRQRRGRELRFEGSETGAHYLLEDAQGVRLLDFHGARDLALHLVRPAAMGTMYLRRLPDGAERTIPPGDEVVRLDQLPIEPPRAGVRGAAHQAFSAIFSLPFDAGAVASYERDADVELRAATRARTLDDRRARLRVAGWSAVAVSAAALAAAGALELSAVVVSGEAGGQTQARVATLNDEIATRNRAAGALLAVGGAALVTGAGLLLWARSLPIVVVPEPEGVSLSATWHF
jgi:hypothetical protein